MKSLGLCLAAYGDLDLETALSAAASHRMKLIDLPLDTSLALRGGRRLIGAAEARRIKRLLDQRQTEVLCISNSRDCQLVLGPHGPHTDTVVRGTRSVKRRHGLRHAREAIQVASFLGSRFVRLFLGCPDYARWLTWGGSSVSWDDNIDALAAELHELIALAEPEGVRLCLEPHPKQAIFDLDSTERLLGRLAEADSRIDVCLDPANLAALGHDPVAFVYELSATPAMVHGKDLQRGGSTCDPQLGWVRYGPQPRVRFRAAGWGEIPWRPLMTALRDRRFEGTVLIEHEDLVLDRERSIDGAVAELERFVSPPVAGKRTW